MGGFTSNREVASEKEELKSGSDLAKVSREHTGTKGWDLAKITVGCVCNGIIQLFNTI